MSKRDMKKADIKIYELLQKADMSEGYIKSRLMNLSINTIKLSLYNLRMAGLVESYQTDGPNGCVRHRVIKKSKHNFLKMRTDQSIGIQYHTRFQLV